MSDFDHLFNGAGGVVHMIVRHDPWCPLYFGEGSSCCCNPAHEIVDPTTFAEVVQRDMRNRAQRRKDAKEARKGGGK